MGKGLKMKKSLVTEFDDDATQFTFIDTDEHTLYGGQETDIKDDGLYAPLEVGSIFLDKYTITEVLGSGNFGIIYRIMANGSLNKSLVVKEFFPKDLVYRDKDNCLALKASLTAQQKKNYKFMHDTFIGEAKNLVKVTEKSHSNIVTIFSLEENLNNTTYFLMNHESGISLKEYVNTRKKETGETFSNSEIYQIAIPLLSGLEQVHGVDVYHQDIKLENILIREDGSPLLLDFGASTILYDTESRKYLNAATPRYAAIEQINLDTPPKIDQRTDIYAMGVLLYKLITDTFPPKAKNRMASITKGGKDPYVSLHHQKLKGFDNHLLSAVDKAMSLSQEDRFENALEFSEALRNTKKRRKYIFWALALSIAGVAAGSYFLIPPATGNLRLESYINNTTVQIDGENRIPGKNNIITLKTGKHHVEMVKEGYVPIIETFEIGTNAMVSIDAELLPKEHDVVIRTNPEDVQIEVNGKPTSHKFRADHQIPNYLIKISTKYHESESIEMTYEELFKQNFFISSQLKQNAVKVSIDATNPESMGKTTIRVNDKIISNRERFFVAKKGKHYKIRILNPYYEEKVIVKSFKELHNNHKISYELTRAKVKYSISTIPDNAMGYISETVNGKFHRIFKQPRKIHGLTTFSLPASDKIQIRIKKEGFEEKLIRRVDLRPGFPTPPLKIKLNPLGGATEEEASSDRPYNHQMIPIQGKGFSVSAYEVNHRAFARFLNGSKAARNNHCKEGKKLYNENLLTHFIHTDTGYQVLPTYKNYPVNMVTWYGARDYTKWLSKETRKHYTLPTKAQWTYVAKKYFDKRNIDNQANYDILNNSGLMACGSKAKNRLGIYDLFGNVFEWTSTKIDIKKHVIKGGSYRSKKSFLVPEKSSREYDNQNGRRDIGFRVFRI